MRLRRSAAARTGWWWAGLAAVVVAVAGVVAVLIFGVLTPSHRSAPGRPLPWRAFYDPGERYLLVWPTGGRCGSETKVSEGTGSITVSVRERSVPPGHGSCISPVSNEHFMLGSPVGSRSVMSADGAGLGTAFRLTERLHARFSGDVSSLPVVSTAVRDANGWRWTLSYYQPSATEAVTLTSTAGDGKSRRPGDVVVRGTRNVLPCAGVLCWNEGGYAYAMSTGPVGGARPLTVGQAVAFADGLVLTG